MTVLAGRPFAVALFAGLTFWEPVECRTNDDEITSAAVPAAVLTFFGVTGGRHTSLITEPA